MSLINKIDNIASVSYGGQTYNSNTATTLLLLPPTVVKVVDKAIASIGDTLTYTITITNLALQTMTNLPFSDTVPAGATYVDDSFTVNGTTVTPTISGDTLSYTVPSIAAAVPAIIQFQVTVDEQVLE